MMETAYQPTERLTWEEIVARYPNEWVYILEPEMGEGVAILSGIVLKHHPNKQELSKSIYAEPTVMAETTLTYTGKLINQNHAWRAISILKETQHSI